MMDRKKIMEESQQKILEIDRKQEELKKDKQIAGKKYWEIAAPYVLGTIIENSEGVKFEVCGVYVCAPMVEQYIEIRFKVLDD